MKIRTNYKCLLLVKTIILELKSIIHDLEKKKLDTMSLIILSDKYYLPTTY